MLNITNKYGPNATVLLPGGCNAACDFCFWNSEEAKIKPPADFIERVFDIVDRLPDEFNCLSISGGEPTLSPIFGKFMSALALHRRDTKLERVVLTTHGGNLNNHIPVVGAAVDHINISRHSVTDEGNFEIFKTKKIPTNKELKKLIKRIHDNTQCDVTLNCVVNKDVSVEFCYEFIRYANDIGADAVSFRKTASDVTKTEAEKYFAKKHGVLGETECEVCRGMEQNVYGFNVRWKGTVHEPSIETNGVYEAVIHPDGNAYTDWGMKHPIELGPSETIRQSIRRLSVVGCGGLRSVGQPIVPKVAKKPPTVDEQASAVIASIRQKTTAQQISSSASGCGTGGGCGGGTSRSGCGSGGC